MNHASAQWTAYQRDRALFPEENAVYPNGRHLFRLSPAHPLLTEDVRQGLHHKMTPTALRATRKEYEEWDLDIFTQRIYQTERQLKFINYLERKRVERKKRRGHGRMEDDDDDDYDDDDGNDLEERSDENKKKRRKHE